MDQGWWDAARPRFWDREEFPTDQDVLEAIWLYHDLERAAESDEVWADAERFRMIADMARLEYQRRSETAGWIAAERDAPSTQPFVTPGTVHPSQHRRRRHPRRGPADAER